MRQFFSPRFWATLLGLVGLTVAAAAVVGHTGGPKATSASALSSTPTSTTSGTGSNAPSPSTTPSSTTGTGSTTDSTAVPMVGDNPHRTIDLVSLVYVARPAKGFGFEHGRTTADLALVLDGTRTMIVKAGTPGESNCAHFTKVAKCVVAGDLLGDGVLWFSLTDGAPGPSVVLPGIVELVDGTWVRLENGWVVRRASLVTRQCATDTSSLKDFVDTFGAKSSATFVLATQQVEKVTCSK